MKSYADGDVYPSDFDINLQNRNDVTGGGGKFLGKRKL